MKTEQEPDGSRGLGECSVRPGFKPFPSPHTVSGEAHLKDYSRNIQTEMGRSLLAISSWQSKTPKSQRVAIWTWLASWCSPSQWKIHYPCARSLEAFLTSTTFLPSLSILPPKSCSDSSTSFLYVTITRCLTLSSGLQAFSVTRSSP